MNSPLINLWEKTLKLNKSEPAIIDARDGSRVSFAELDEAICKKIAYLKPFRIENKIIAFKSPNSAEWLVNFISLQKLNAVALPLAIDTPRTSVEELTYKLKAYGILDENELTLLENSRRLRDVCLIKMTSGSTGTPKPIYFEVEQILADGYNLIQTMKIKADDINLGIIPFGHSYGLGNLILPLLIQGNPIVLPVSHFPHAIGEAISNYKITILPAVPLLLKGLVHSQVDQSDLQSLKLVLSAGNALPVTVAQEFYAKFNLKIHNFLGTSETGGIAFDRDGEDTLKGTSVGTPLENVNLSISPHRRLIVESKAVFRRYNKTKTPYTQRFMTHDIVEILSGKRLKLIGRSSKLIKIAGKRLNLEEVEKVIEKIDAVQNVCVFTFEDRIERLRIGALIRADNLDAKILKEKVSTILEPWKIPNRWIFISNWPSNKSGKIEKKTIQSFLKDGEKA